MLQQVRVEHAEARYRHDKGGAHVHGKVVLGEKFAHAVRVEIPALVCDGQQGIAALSREPFGLL